MPSHPQENRNSRKFIVGNAFIACLLAGLFLAIVMPSGIFVFNISDANNLDIFSSDFLFMYFWMSVTVGFYSVLLSCTLGLITLLTFHHFRLNYPILLFLMGGFYTLLLLVLISGGIDILQKSVVIWVFILCGGICGFTACYLFNKKCQQQLAE